MKIFLGPSGIGGVKEAEDNLEEDPGVRRDPLRTCRTGNHMNRNIRLTMVLAGGTTTASGKLLATATC